MNVRGASPMSGPDHTLLDWLRCPECGARVAWTTPDECRCGGCARRYAVRDGVPNFTREASPKATAFGYLWGLGTAVVEPPTTTRPYHLSEMHDALGIPPLTGRLIDGGCGDGTDLAMKALDPRCEILGVELSDGGVATSRAYTRGLPRAHLVQADLLTLPLADSLFDGGYSYGVVHHTPDPERAVRELARVLKPHAPLLLYVYEDFADRRWYWRLALGLVNSVRHLTTRTPPPILMALCRIMSPLVYVTMTLPSRHFRLAARFPYRHGTTPSSLTGDLFDRFSAPIERRYSEAGARTLAEQAGLRVVQTAQRRGWMVWAEKP